MKKHAFKLGLLVYALVWLILTGVIWFGLWNYADAYELAQPKGAMNAYMEQRLQNEITAQVEAYSASAANDYQSQEEIFAYYTETLVNKDWSYRRSRESTLDAPVYTLYSGDEPVCKVNLVPGEPGALAFGQVPWEVLPMDAKLAERERAVTIVAPVGCDVTFNGKEVTGSGDVMTQYPAFDEFAEDIKVPMELTQCTIEGIALGDIPVKVSEGYKVLEQEKDIWYVVPEADEQTRTEIEDFAPKFADAYLMFTSNAGSFYTVQPYVAPDGALMDRLRRSLDGMGWVHYTTGKIMDLDVSNLEYYGNAFTFDAAYLLNLKSGEMEGNMHVVAVRTHYGWRAVSVELF